MLGALDLRGRPAHPTPQVQQVCRIQGLAAVVALVAPGPGTPAMRAGPFDIAVGQVAAAALAVRQHHVALVDVVHGKQLQEDVLDDLAMVVGARGSEQVEGDAHPVPGLQEQGLEPVHHHLRRDAFLLGAEGYGRPVLVGPRHHDHLVPLGAMVSGEDVGGEVGPGQVAQVQRPVGIGPGDCD